MTMGEYIKYLREQAKMSQEELGKSLNPPVNRAAVNKWESGMVENIKRNHIKQMADKFGVTPADLMCFDSKYDTPSQMEESKTYEMVEQCFGKQACTLLHGFDQLNNVGKHRLLEHLDDLLNVPKYQ